MAGIISGAVFNPEAAKTHVAATWAELQSLDALASNGDINGDAAHAAVQRFRKLPTFQINWGLIGTSFSPSF